MKAWHFSNNNKRLGFFDNRQIELGKTLSVDVEPELCKQGLHGSIKILDALSYATGSIIWRVNISGKIKKSDDKIVGQNRKTIAGGINIQNELRKFARWCALQVIHLWDAPNIVIKYLKTGDEKIRAASWAVARDVARAAVRARAASWAVARDVARDETRDTAAAAARAAAAAMAAARDTARNAAMAAARAAARAGARAAFYKKANKKLTQMVNKKIKDTE